MADEAKRCKNERTYARRMFNRITKTIGNALLDGSPAELVDGMLEELKETRKELTLRHRDYLVVTLAEDEDAVEGEDDYLEGIDTSYRTTVGSIFEYKKGVVEEFQRLKLEKEKSQHEVAAAAAVEEENRTLATLRNIRFMEHASLHVEIERALSLTDKDVGLVSLEGIESGIRLQFSLVNSANIKIIERLGESDAKEEVKLFVDVRSKYLAALDIITGLKDEKCVAGKKSSKTEATENTVQLQKIPLPSFNGNQRDYPKFKNDFCKYVLPKIKDKETTAYILTSCLTGEPLELVKNVDDDADRVWDRLDEIYGDASKLTDMVMNDIKRMSALLDDDDLGLITLVDIMERGYRDLMRLGMEGEISNSQTVSLVEEKLPRDLKLAWSKEVKRDGSDIKWTNKFPKLLSFLLEQKRIREYANADLRSSSIASSGATHYVNQSTSNATICIIHSTDKHSTASCRAYLALEPKGRLDLLSKHKACYTCLRPHHFSKNCWKKVKCGVDECEQIHHSSLHDALKQGVVLRATKTDTEVDGSCLLQLMKIQTALHTPRNLTVLWDSGASLCLITFRKANELKLKGKPTQLSIVKVGGNPEVISSFSYNVPVVDDKGKVTIIKAYGINEITSKIEHINVSMVAHLFKETTVEEIERPCGNVDLLIGFNYAGLHPVREQVAGNLLLLKNAFGRCLGGTHKSLHEKTVNHLQNAVILFALVYKTSFDSFLEGENLGVSCKPKCGSCGCGKCMLGTRECTLKEERELHQIEENMNFMGNHWEASYPWIKDPNLLVDNRVAAVAMLRSTEKRLSKNPELVKVYGDQIKDLVERNVPVKLSECEMMEYKGPVHYLSHHEVLKQDSKSTPCRLVFNASAKFRGQVINDFWAKGPDLLNNPLGILIRFREREHGVAGDISKMYHSVKLKPGVDCHTHRFLWRDMDDFKEPETYMMTAVSFGDRPAGAIAAVALQKTAEMGRSTYPEAADIVENNTYVDDILDSFDTTEMAMTTSKEITELLKIGGFNIKGWTHSSKQSSESDESVQFFLVTGMVVLQQNKSLV